MDRQVFYNKVGSFTKLSDTQHQGFEYIWNEWDRHLFTDNDARKLAYCFATAWHETNKTMQPVREAYYLGSKAEAYRKTLKYYPYYGRGYVELTWDYNYDKYGIKDDPDKALDPVIAARIMIDGMTNGTFTGKKLQDYFNDRVTDPDGARRIINGNDKAGLISQYWEAFHEALTDQA